MKIINEFAYLTHAQVCQYLNTHVDLNIHNFDVVKDVTAHFFLKDGVKGWQHDY